jgi:hypothetical protein
MRRCGHRLFVASAPQAGGPNPSRSAASHACDSRSSTPVAAIGDGALLATRSLQPEDEMRRFAFAVLIGAGSLLTALGCSTNRASNGAGSDPGAGDPSVPQANDAGVSDAGPSSANDLGASADSGSSVPTNGFDCSAAGIAAYADQLVIKARTSCTQDGVGVVKDDNYNCMSAPINQVNPPYASASFNIVSTLLANNTQYPFLECTYFVQTVTTGVCNTPISPSDTAWTDYPLACSFINKQIAGYQWIDKAQGTVQVGDILLYTSSDNCNNDPGHIMIVVEVKDSSHFRVAEANEVTSAGSVANGKETGVVSNTRIQTLDDPYLASRWFRKSGS